MGWGAQGSIVPHLTLQYSANLEAQCDLSALCGQLNDAMVETGIFPLGGIRVRAFAANHVSIADKHPNNAFAAIQLFIGAGRALEDKQRAGARITAVAEDFFAPQLADGHFMLSVDMFENDPALSWKVNSIHGRLKAAAAESSRSARSNNDSSKGT